MDSLAPVDLDDETKENIARALWMREFVSESIPPDLMRKLGDVKNSETAFGKRMRHRISDLLANPEKFTPDYSERYNLLCSYSSELSAHQAYAMSNLLGLDSARGYQELPTQISFKFPYDDKPQFQYQVGWHFFVGTAKGADDQEFGVQLMFWSHSVLPPVMARKEGLSDLENQIAEVHFAISSSGYRHFRTRPVLIAGTTGLVRFSDQPFDYSIGNNSIKSLVNDSLFPIHLQAWGIANNEENPVEIAIDIILNQTKGYVLNGDQGLSPSCGGVGTIYYSVPNLRIKPGESCLSINGTKIRLTGGKFWYDHQWGTGFMPSGSPRSDLLRAANILDEQEPGGWDWMEIQFEDDTELMLYSTHNNDNIGFYSQTGQRPPGIMTLNAKGSYIRQNGKYEAIKAEILVTDWVQSFIADGWYLATNTWYPNRLEVTIRENEVPEDRKHFVMVPIVKTGQQGFFASGAQYSEGAVIIESPDGIRIGVGFLENVSYADARRQNLRLAGLPDTNDMVQLFSKVKVSEDMKEKAKTFLQDPVNIPKLMKELAESKGL